MDDVESSSCLGIQKILGFFLHPFRRLLLLLLLLHTLFSGPFLTIEHEKVVRNRSCQNKNIK